MFINIMFKNVACVYGVKNRLIENVLIRYEMERITFKRGHGII